MIEPTAFQPYVPGRPGGNALSRGLRALLVEHRMPYAARKRFDRAMNAAGLRSRTKRIGPFRVSFRRGTNDESFIQNIIEREEYFRDGYRPANGETVIDIGANMGTFTLAAAKYGARVIAVEPFPDNLRYLKRNVERNGIRAQIVEAGIASTEGVRRLFVGRDTGFHSLLIDQGRGAIEIRTIKLAQLLERYCVERCDLLKIDCEGAEFEFLPTVKPETWEKIERISMEYTVPIDGWQLGSPTPEHVRRKRALSDSLIEILERNAFRIDAYEDCISFMSGYIFARRRPILRR